MVWYLFRVKTLKLDLSVSSFYKLFSYCDNAGRTVYHGLHWGEKLIIRREIGFTSFFLSDNLGYLQDVSNYASHKFFSNLLIKPRNTSWPSTKRLLNFLKTQTTSYHRWYKQLIRTIIKSIKSKNKYEYDSQIQLWFAMLIMQILCIIINCM